MNADPKRAGQTRRRSPQAACGHVKHSDAASGCRRVSTRGGVRSDEHAKKTTHVSPVPPNKEPVSEDQLEQSKLRKGPGVWTRVSDCSEWLNYSDTNLTETERDEE